MSDPSRHEQLLEIFMVRATSPEHNAAKNEIESLRAQLAKLEKAKKPAAPKKRSAKPTPKPKK